MKYTLKILAPLVFLMACGPAETPVNNENNARPVVEKEQVKVSKRKQAALADEPPGKKVISKPSAKVATKNGAEKENEMVSGGARIIYNSSRTLNWSDFRGRVNKGMSHAAFTETGMTYEPQDYNKDFVVLKVESYFDKNRSWVKSDKKTSYLLNHEQKHFDICELFRRKMMRDLDRAQPINPARFNAVVKKAFNKNFKAMNAFQQKYDRETNHSIIKKSQIKWDKNIARELASLSSYRKMTLRLKMK